MPRFFKVVVALSLLIVLAVAMIAVRRHRVRQAIAIAELYEAIRPVPTNAPRIPAPVLSQLVNADFKVVTNLRDIPSPVKDSFCNIEWCNYMGVKFDMVNPGDTMSTDYIIEGVPQQGVSHHGL